MFWLGVTDKTGHCICSYIEKCSPQQTTKGAWTKVGQTSACPGWLRLAQPWCPAQHAWPSHCACGCDWSFPRDVHNPTTHDKATQTGPFLAMEVTGGVQLCWCLSSLISLPDPGKPGMSDQIYSPNDTSRLSCSARSKLLQTPLISVISLMLGFTIASLPGASNRMLKWGRKNPSVFKTLLSFSADADALHCLFFQWRLSEVNISWRWSIIWQSNICFLFSYTVP